MNLAYQHGCLLLKLFFAHGRVKAHIKTVLKGNVIQWYILWILKISWVEHFYMFNHMFFLAHFSLNPTTIYDLSTYRKKMPGNVTLPLSVRHRPLYYHCLASELSPCSSRRRKSFLKKLVLLSQLIRCYRQHREVRASKWTRDTTGLNYKIS